MSSSTSTPVQAPPIRDHHESTCSFASIGSKVAFAAGLILVVIAIVFTTTQCAPAIAFKASMSGGFVL